MTARTTRQCCTYKSSFVWLSALDTGVVAVNDDFTKSIMDMHILATFTHVNK